MQQALSIKQRENMKTFLNIVSSLFFFVSYRFFELVMGKEVVMDELSKHISKSIVQDIKVSLIKFEDIEDEEIIIMKDLLFLLYTSNFRFLSRERLIIRERVCKQIDRKIKWILANK